MIQLKTTNMKTFIHGFTIVILLSIVSCSTSITSSNNTENYSVSNFLSLNLELLGDVYYEQSDSSYVEVSGSSDLIEQLKVSSNDGMLSIKLEGIKKFSLKRRELIVKIGSPQLEVIDFNGIGTFYISKFFKGNSLSITNSGVGKIKIDSCNVKSFHLNSSAVGSIEVKGSSQTSVIQSEGLGKIDCSEFRTSSTKVESKGIGDMAVYAQDSIEMVVLGTGHIKYYGNPLVVRSDISGLGKVTKMSR